MNLPQIRIQGSHLIYGSISEEERQKWADGKPLRSFEELQEYVQRLADEWKTIEGDVLNGMVSMYGVTFRKPIIDVYVTPWNKSISDPLILDPNRPPEVQVDTLMHELLHNLFTDNSAFSINDQNEGFTLGEKWRELFGSDHAWKTLVHIPVHAGLKALFLDVMYDPERLTRDIARHVDHPAYKSAWEYVEANDYKVINEKLKDLYQKINL